MVVTDLPSALDTAVRQEKTRLPSSSTEHAPQRASPQPYFVPVMCKSSRSTSSSGRSGSVLTDFCCPLIVNAIICGKAWPSLGREEGKTTHLKKLLLRRMK